MLNVKISKGETSVINASGAVEEILTDIVVLVNTIHTQFSNADPETAKRFRAGLIGIVNDPTGHMWTPLEGQTGIIFPKLEGEA